VSGPAHVRPPGWVGRRLSGPVVRPDAATPTLSPDYNPPRRPGLIGHEFIALWATGWAEKSGQKASALCPAV
jgi:hypothetical protein